MSDLYFAELGYINNSSGVLQDTGSRTLLWGNVAAKAADLGFAYADYSDMLWPVLVWNRWAAYSLRLSISDKTPISNKTCYNGSTVYCCNKV